MSEKESDMSTGGSDGRLHYVLYANFPDDLGGEQRPCIYLERSENGRFTKIWKQTFADWVQRDATFDRLYDRQDQWNAWGEIFSQKGAAAFSAEISQYYLDTSDIYPTGERTKKSDRLCMFLARGDEDDPLIIMVDMSDRTAKKVAELSCSDIATRNWAHSWLMSQLNRSQTFFRILEEDGEWALQRFLNLIIARFGPA